MKNNNPRKPIWNRRIESARSTLSPGQETKVWKYDVNGEPPAEFTRSIFSFARGANAVYRDGNATNTLQIREYDNYHQIQMDHYHPVYHPIGHIFNDISDPVEQIGVTAGLSLAVGLGGRAVLSALE
jgi:hypothetical protein